MEEDKTINNCNDTALEIIEDKSINEEKGDMISKYFNGGRLVLTKLNVEKKTRPNGQHAKRPSVRIFIYLVQN